MRKNFLPALALSAALALLCACGAHDAPAPGAANANSTSNSNAPGAYQGAGPHNAGVGGTGEDNRNAVSGNSNVEPPGVNKNVRGTNSDSSAPNSNR